MTWPLTVTEYVAQMITDSTKELSETSDIVKMLEFFFMDNIFVMFGGHVFQQTVGIPMGISYAPLLADLFFYSHGAYFIKGLLKTIRSYSPII